VRAFWYISQDKLRVMSAERRGALSIFDRLSGKVQVAVGVASVEAGIDKAAIPSLIQNLDRVEKKLTREGALIPAASISENTDPVTFFEFRGPSSRFAASDAFASFWVAVACESTGVLLVGSIANSIGAKPEGFTRAFSPSVDPLGAVDYFTDLFANPPDEEAESRRLGDLLQVKEREEARQEAWKIRQAQDLRKHTSDVVDYAWSSVMYRHVRPGEARNRGLFPHTRGIAIFAGIKDVTQDDIAQEANIRRIIVGSPLFVEQISAPRSPTRK
jgi:hypothetical protein